MGAQPKPFPPIFSDIADNFGYKCPCSDIVGAITEICMRRVTMYKQTFGKRLTQLMDERGWTVERGAAIFGVSDTMIKKYRSGQNFPEAELLCKMSDILNVSLDWLVGRTDQREVISAEPCNQ